MYMYDIFICDDNLLTWYLFDNLIRVFTEKYAYGLNMYLSP